jgi:uncharacterized protein (TIGR03435 family)
MTKLLLAALLSAAAQASSFEVASVKPVNPPAGTHIVSLLINHQRVNIEAAELRQIVGLAYAIQRVRVVGGPDWADADQFDIAAKTEAADPTRDEVRSMLRSLLAERFRLAVHPETKEAATYSLVAAKGGAKLKTAAPDRPAGMSDRAGPGGAQQTVFQSSPLRILVNMLANTLSSPVVDNTGLTGLYDYTLEWPEAGGSLMASLEQLGLKLEAKKAPVEVLVIDHAERPTAN